MKEIQELSIYGMDYREVPDWYDKSKVLILTDDNMQQMFDKINELVEAYNELASPHRQQ